MVQNVSGYEHTARQGTLGEPAPSVVVVGLASFAALQLALALVMVLSPHRFFVAVGPFGAFNAHYIRDVASFYSALGGGLLIAIRRVSWRVPVLAIATLQYGLHSLNHLLDIANAHPPWTGYFDFATLALATALLAGLWRTAARDYPRAGGGAR